MLLSHRKQFIYTKTVKTAGTSVEVFFEPYCMAEGEWTPSHRREVYSTEAGIIGFRGANMPPQCPWWNHMPAHVIQRQVGDDIWNTYYKFCVIRCPYEKAISHFFHSYFKHTGVPLEERVPKDEPGLFERYLETFGPPIDRDKYMIDGTICVDDIIRQENLVAELRRICTRLNIDAERLSVPQLKSARRPVDATVASLYTEKSRRIVEEIYAFEIDRFGYSYRRAAAA